MLLTNNILYKLYNSVDLFEFKSLGVCYVALHKPVGCTSLAHVVKNVIPNVLYTIHSSTKFFKDYFLLSQRLNQKNFLTFPSSKLKFLSLTTLPE